MPRPRVVLRDMLYLSRSLYADGTLCRPAHTKLIMTLDHVLLLTIVSRLVAHVAGIATSCLPPLPQYPPSSDDVLAFTSTKFDVLIIGEDTCSLFI